MKVSLSMRNSSMTESEMNAYLQMEPMFYDYKVTRCEELVYVNFSHRMFTCECDILIRDMKTNEYVTTGGKPRKLTLSDAVAFPNHNSVHHE